VAGSAPISAPFRRIPQTISMSQDVSMASLLCVQHLHRIRPRAHDLEHECGHDTTDQPTFASMKLL
jgi:hypothetical protein